MITNDDRIRITKNALGQIEDNLYRANMQLKADASWVSGSGQTIEEYILELEKDAAPLRVEIERLKRLRDCDVCGGTGDDECPNCDGVGQVRIR